MAQKFLFALGALFIISVILCLCALTPYWFYWKVLINNEKTDWYALNRKDLSLLYTTQIFQRSKIKVDSSQWKDFHLGDYIIPIPVRNPSLYPSPAPIYLSRSRKTLYGVHLKNYEGELKYLLRERIPLILKRRLNEQKLFRVPWFREILSKIPLKDLWRDIFTRDLKNIAIHPKELLYHFYILHLRTKLFPDNIISFSFFEDKSMGIIKQKSPHPAFSSELFLMHRLGNINSIQILEDQDLEDAQGVKFYLLKSLSYRESDPALAHIIIKEYSGLEYQERGNATGIMTIYSAWSQDNNKRYIQEIVKLYEQQKNVLNVLTPIYDYGISRFGTLDYFKVTPLKNKKKRKKIKNKRKHNKNVNNKIKENEFIKEEDYNSLSFD